MTFELQRHQYHEQPDQVSLFCEWKLYKISLENDFIQSDKIQCQCVYDGTNGNVNSRRNSNTVAQFFTPTFFNSRIRIELFFLISRRKWWGWGEERNFIHVRDDIGRCPKKLNGKTRSGHSHMVFSYWLH